MRTQAGVDGDVKNVVGHLGLEKIGLRPGVGAQDPFGLKREGTSDDRYSSVIMWASGSGIRTAPL